MWFHYSGAESLMLENEGLYEILSFREEQDIASGCTKHTNKLMEFIEVIDKDLQRTFPTNTKFNPNTGNSSQDTFVYDSPEIDITDILVSYDVLDGDDSSDQTLTRNDRFESVYIQSLRRILVAFTYYSWPHPDKSRTCPRQCSYNIGYCQSLNFIVGFLLLVYTDSPDPTSFQSASEQKRKDVEVRVFWTLVVMVEKLLPPEMYGQHLAGSQLQQVVFWKYILSKNGLKYGVEKIGKWVEYMEGHSSRKGKKISVPIPPLNMITTSWFMTLFINALPIDSVLRVWDCFF